MKSPHVLCKYLIKKARQVVMTGFCIVPEGTLRYRDPRNTLPQIPNQPYHP